MTVSRARRRRHGDVTSGVAAQSNPVEMAREAARKIAFFKICNAGQICIDINQVAVAQKIAGEFLEALKDAFRSQIGEDAQNNDEYSKLITPQAAAVPPGTVFGE